MSNTGNQVKTEARPMFRVLAGVLAVLMLCFGVPLGVYLGISGSSDGWVMIPPFLVVGSGFASVAWKGHWFPFRKPL
jgi:hypothetical protein